ncbi:MAG: hypothetical protein WA139_03770 [Candidatus Aenigmatarchaeota archaeon]
MGGEKGIPIAVAERRAKVDDFGKTVVYDTIENIVNLYKTIIGEHGGSQEESTSISDILKIDGNALEGSPQTNDAFPFTIAGFIPVPISQQISVTNLSHLAYFPVKSAETLYHGYKKGYRGKIHEADNFIKELFDKRTLTAEEMKKELKEVIPPYTSYAVPSYHAYFGGRPTAPRHIVPYMQAYLGGITGQHGPYVGTNEDESEVYNPSDFVKNPYLARTLSKESSIIVNPIPNLEEIRNYFERGG